MKRLVFLIALLFPFLGICQDYSDRLILNGVVAFEQSVDAFPPAEFTRKIQVPGLIDLATPKIEQYEAYFQGKHEPRYSWYKFKFQVPTEHKGKFAVLKILKSRYNTQIILNGHDCGTYMQCNTPIDADLSPFILEEGENELLVRIGERTWLPKEAATGFDREKYTDIPGIWDDIFIDFGGPVKVHRMLALPSLKSSSLTAKIVLENYAQIVERNMEWAELEYTLNVFVREKISGKKVTEVHTEKGEIGCQQAKEIEVEMPINQPKSWSPEVPFLYELVAEIQTGDVVYKNYGNKEIVVPPQDNAWSEWKSSASVTFGMRDFEARGRDFSLNGEPVHLYGSTITLNRFFEDKDRKHLPWDRAWVEDLMVNIPKSMKWNFFRVSIGLLPDFWYDLADEHGIMIQNEYLMWNLRGRPSQYEKEYTDWVWSDGNHPSIIIWDALNEQKEDYIGRVLIPKLKIIDHTRIWDLGYMKHEDVGRLEMNEIHWYPLAHGWWVNDQWYQEHIPAFRFGRLKEKYPGMSAFHESTAPIIVNEYGWIWQSRNGLKSGVRTYGSFVEADMTPYSKNYEYFEADGTQMYGGRDIYDYFLGENASAEERRHFQAYMIAMQTEIIRATNEADGVASFAYLSNNNGYTGDWFEGDIANLKPAPALLAQYACMQPFAAFLDVQDARYLKNSEYFTARSKMQIPIWLTNDTNEDKQGKLQLQIINSRGDIVLEQSKSVNLSANWQQTVIFDIDLPKKNGGYMLISTLYEKDNDKKPQQSVRYIKVGASREYSFPDFEYSKPKNWPK